MGGGNAFFHNSHSAWCWAGGRMDWSSGRFRWSAYGFLAKFLVGVVRLLHLVLRRLKLSVFDNGSNVLMPY